MLSVTWFPPDVASITFDDSPFGLADIDGLSSTLAKPKTRQGPNQIGVSLTGVSVDPRVITMAVELIAGSAAEMWTLRQQLAAAFATQPDSPTGTLRLMRSGLPTVDIDAIPQTAPEIKMKNEFYAVATIRFFCPNPYFKDPTDSTVLLAILGGLQFVAGSTIQFPLEIKAFNVQQDINNAGTAPTPVLIKIYGACITPRVRNLTTGEVLEISGTINNGDYIEINTAYGSKSVTYVDALGVRTNIMNRLSTTSKDFWQLKAGVNTVKFDPGSSTSGNVVVAWRQKYSGV
jgi:hypothetical protein